MMNKVIKLAIGNNIRDVNLRNVKLSWDDFKSHILNPAKKSIDYNVIAGSNNTVKLTHAEIIKRAIASIKPNLQYFVGGYFNPLKRNNSNIKARTLIVLDIDNYQGTIDDLAKTIASDFTNYDYIAYATASHRANKPCIRVVLRCSEEIEPNIYKNIVEAFVKDLSFKDSIDIKASTTSSQAMYLPAIIDIESQPDNEEPYVYEYWTQENTGEPINIKKYSAQVTKKQEEPLEKISNPDIHDYNQIAVSTEKVIDCLNKYPVDKLDFYAWLEVAMALHHNYQGSDEGYLILDEWSRKDARYDEPNNRKHWDSFKSKSKIKTFASIIKIVNEQDKGCWKKEIKNQIEDLKEDFDEELDLMPIISGIAKHCSQTESEFYVRKIKSSTKLGLDFIRNLINKEYKKITIEATKSYESKIFKIDEPLPRAMFPDFVDSDKPPKTTLPNFKVILQGYGITIKRNLISREEEIEIPGQTYCRDTKLNASYNQLVSICEMNGMAKNNLINGYCNNIGSQNVYNPVLDYIQSKQWDGKSRLQALYDTIIIEDDYPLEERNLYVRKWLISAVAALCVEKGLKSKGVLLFQGKQSTNKSPWFQSLVPKELGDYFCENFNLNPLDKDSVATGNSFWIVDLGEFDRMMRSNTIGSMKAYISSNKSVLRRAYAAKNEFFYRRNVFCGTVNPKEFLKDRTGNVRYWCIPVKQLLSTEHIDMQQLWAELYEIYKTGERWWLIPEEEERLEISNKRFLEICSVEETFLSEYEPYTGEKSSNTNPPFKIGIKRLMDKLGWKLPIPKKDMGEMKAMLDRLGTKYIKKTKEFVIQKKEINNGSGNK